MAVNIREVSTEALAYLGDSVIEQKVRMHLVERGLSRSGDLNRESLKYVKAGAQARAMQRILPMLSEDEEVVFRRGRNMSVGNVPKSSTAMEYRLATGMEALFGYLFLSGSYQRADELFCAAYADVSRAEENI